MRASATSPTMMFSMGIDWLNFVAGRDEDEHQDEEAES